MDTENLICHYQEALSNDDRLALKNIAEDLRGKKVTASVQWQKGRTTETTGVVHLVYGDKVYLDCLFGLVEGDANTMISAEDELDSGDEW